MTRTRDEKKNDFYRLRDQINFFNRIYANFKLSIAALMIIWTCLEFENVFCDFWVDIGRFLGQEGNIWRKLHGGGGLMMLEMINNFSPLLSFSRLWELCDRTVGIMESPSHVCSRKHKSEYRN